MEPLVYQLEVRRRNTNDEWRTMTYFPRSYHACEELLDHYEEKWGNHYSYRIEVVK